MCTPACLSKHWDLRAAAVCPSPPVLAACHVQGRPVCSSRTLDGTQYARQQHDGHQLHRLYQQHLQTVDEEHCCCGAKLPTPDDDVSSIGLNEYREQHIVGSRIGQCDNRLRKLYITQHAKLVTDCCADTSVRHITINMLKIPAHTCCALVLPVLLIAQQHWPSLLQQYINTTMAVHLQKYIHAQARPKAWHTPPLSEVCIAVCKWLRCSALTATLTMQQASRALVTAPA